ncbi:MULTISPECIES: class I SAM-dependent methyltransferase [Vibrio]|uniref:Class I SAM-dependent methyltransferase n=1 Tax=Vibrio ostreae TaxID=2841925 RepID=A0A975UAB0_9VIBR|nr:MULTISPECIES: class I SAM-dependent methyltransferase [Vibrio]QXO16844.1 class I SAM-dependent methyltransferase [Vibrio ostreae]
MRIENNEDKDWIEYINGFSDNYNDRVYSNSTGLVMNKGHQSCEEKFAPSDHFDNVLEIGSGTGEHFKFVRHSFREYTFTDCDHNNLEKINNNLSNDIRFNKLKFEVMDARKLDFKDESFDRIIATHLLEHLTHPHLVIKEWKRVLRKGGTLSILIPTDPGVLWKMGRYFTTRRNAIKKGINYDYIMAREHINSCNNLISLLNYYFPNSESHFWPLKVLPSIDLNLFYIFHSIK